MTSLAERDRASMLHTYTRLPLEIDRGEGVHLVDASGRRYLDFFGGLAVNALGYGHPAVLAAIRSQSERYLHLSNLFAQEPQVALAERLRAMSGFDRVFFANSGAETIEAAFKLVRRIAASEGRTEIIAFSDAFHGRTMTGLSLMDAEKYRSGFGPFLDGCRTLPFNDPGAIHASIGPRTAAVFVECLQGEGGVVPMTDDFARALRQAHADHGFLLVDDEIQTGMGRTGRFLAAKHFDLRPDIVLLAKSLGGGLPLGAMLVHERLAHVFGPGGHGSTFGGNPVACAAGVAVMDQLRNGMIEHAGEAGRLLHAGLERLRADFPRHITEVRGLGCMQGIVCTFPARPVMEHCLDHGLLVNVTRERVIRLLPPLTIAPSHIDEALTALRNAFDVIDFAD